VRCMPLASALMLVPPPAAAEGFRPRLHAGAGRAGVVSELRGGVLLHDLHDRERGADINGELLFATPVPRGWTRDAAPWLRWSLEPRPHFGFSANTAGYTSQGYFGLTWTAFLRRDLLRPGDGVRVDLSFGGSVNDGRHAVSIRRRPRVGLIRRLRRRPAHDASSTAAARGGVRRGGRRCGLGRRRARRADQRC
jgi:lipid A 3-O-deacylase